MQSGYIRDYPLQYTNYPSQYEVFDQISYAYPQNVSYNMASTGAGHAGSTYDKICMYYCIEPRCPAHYSIILQDYTSGTLSEEDINRLVDINTGFKCPAHEPALTRAYVRFQWEIPENTILSKSVQLAHRVKDKKHLILCPEKGCGATFKTKSDFKRGFGRIEEVISHLRNENGQHHDAVRYRPVEGWDFRRKTPAETQDVLDNMEFISEEELYDHYRRQEEEQEQYYY
ncbi:hypothetical protein Dda_6746 [Drechslerella dactyloides]|uniref:Uncharacterized protein n=1 Tax=Drechslerella dactyloides TaxID=74499 RepID=A0AAD6NHT9_DREDA|nr:hypothetical protein Dda_6746 [Drechslerella dactyloides]